MLSRNMLLFIILKSTNSNRYIEHYLTASSVPFPIQRYPTIEDLAEAVLRKFPLRNISDLGARSVRSFPPWSSRAVDFRQNISSTTRVGTGAIIWPVEVCYQDEFYRCLQEVLGFSSNVSSEWLGDGDGRIDFRLADVAWGIELLRDGDRLHAHCSRFVNNGSYTPWIQKGWLRNWLIIECRTSPPRPYSK